MGEGMKLEVRAKWWRKAAGVCLSDMAANLLPAASPVTQQSPRGWASITENQERELWREKKKKREREEMDMAEGKGNTKILFMVDKRVLPQSP